MGGRFLALNREDQYNIRRVHVTNPLLWAVTVGTDYWIHASANGQGTTGGQNLLTDGGWTTTSLTYSDGSAADFITKSDVGSPGSYVTNAQNDLIQSPAIFGSYLHAHAAAVIAGQSTLPRYLIADMYATFSTESADEQTTNLGLVEAGGGIKVAADLAAAFNSDSTSFRFEINGTRGTDTSAVAVDTVPHWFRVVCDRQAGTTGKAYPYIDGTLTISGGVALTDDIWPVSFGAGNGGATNLIQLHQAHIFYAWTLPNNPGVF